MRKAFELETDHDLTKKMLNLGTIFTQKINDATIFFIKTSFETNFGIHGHGYTHMGALTALAVKHINP